MSSSGSVEVFLGKGTSSQAISALEDTLAAAGFQTNVQAASVRVVGDRGTAFVDTCFSCALPAVARAFTHGIDPNAGESSWASYRAGDWRGIETYFAAVSRAVAPQRAVLQIRGPDIANVMVGYHVPSGALEALGDLDWDRIPADVDLEWDRNDWRLFKLWPWRPRSLRKAAPKLARRS
jgi:hypothetical protein